MSLRRVVPLVMDDATKFEDIEGDYPAMVELDPTEILIEESYQRQPSERTKRLVRRGAVRFSWRKFTPPKVVRIEAGWVATDGQHTAIMAATRGLKKIWCQNITAATVEERAQAFLGQNLDHTSVTQMQLHKARVVGGDEDALTIEQVCQRAGVTLCGFVRSTWQKGDTMAIGAIRGLISKRSAQRARKVLDVLVQADLRPITAEYIKAVDAVMNEPQFKDMFSDATIARALQVDYDRIEREAAEFSKAQRIPKWRGTVAALYKGAGRAKASL